MSANLNDGFPRVIVGKDSKLIGQPCPICKESFLFGERLCLVDRKGVYAHDDCIYKDAEEVQNG